MQVFAHRGVPYVAPENTLISYSLARSLGAGIEVDVRLSSDGVPVCIHDATLDRTTDGTGLVRSHSLEELRRLDAGGWFGEQFARERIPTLEDVLNLLKATPMAIEMKCAGTEDRIVQVIERTGTFENTFVIDNIDAIDAPRRVKAVNPKVKTAAVCLCREDYLALKNDKLKAIDAIWGWVYSGWLDERQVKEIHDDGLRIYAGNLNRQEDLRRYLDYGVDGICTDHPADLLNVLGDAAPKERA